MYNLEDLQKRVKGELSNSNGSVEDRFAFGFFSQKCCFLVFFLAIKANALRKIMFSLSRAAQLKTGNKRRLERVKR